MPNKIRRGEIYYIKNGFQTTGSEQRPGRPAIIVSNDVNNEFSSTVEVVYLTTQPKQDMPTHVEIKCLKRGSTALCEQITAVAVERLENYCGEVHESEMQAIEAAMAVSLGLNVNKSSAQKASDKDVAKRCAAAEAKCAVLQEMYDALLGKVINSK